MCGICGEVRFDGKSVAAEPLAAMVASMAPRGPDSSGLVLHDRIGLGHRRLSIIDLSVHARQPMVDAELGLSIVYNGAIYNYAELRQELTERGYRFFSSGDTEVILKAYHAFGPAAVERLSGMFAFAIAERDSGRVFLARDRFGIKPLYVARTPKALRFASTLPALLAGGDVNTSIDPVALHHYLTLHAVVPAPHTILAGVQKLAPATTLMVEPDGRSEERRYFSLRFEPERGKPGASFEEEQERVLEALRVAVRRRLVADVPVGVLLSGGLDSSLLVALLAEEGQRGLETFSVGFESVGGEEGNEFFYSDIIAKRFETRHHRIFAGADRTLESLPRAISAMSEPMVSHDAVGFYLLSEEVSRHVKVVQSGQGADEVFAGYHWYPPLLERKDGATDYARVFFDRSHEEMGEVVEDAYLGADHSRALLDAHFATPGADRVIDKALRLDTEIMLVDDPVKRVDNMTMAFGLEARVPFLDHELVEVAASVPAEMKVRDGGKGVLKAVARRLVPAEVIDRPKGYFPVPALKYLRGPYLSLVRDVLTSRRARERGVFRQGYVERLFADPEGHVTPLRGSKLWQLGLLELWFQAQGL